MTPSARSRANKRGDGFAFGGGRLLDVGDREGSPRHGAARGQEGALHLGGAQRARTPAAPTLRMKLGAILGARAFGRGDPGPAELAQGGLAAVAGEEHQHGDGARGGDAGAEGDGGVVDEASRARRAPARLRGPPVEDPPAGAEAGAERHRRREEDPRVGAGRAEGSRRSPRRRRRRRRRAAPAPRRRPPRQGSPRRGRRGSAVLPRPRRRAWTGRGAPRWRCCRASAS